MVDFNINKGEPTINDDIDLILQQIDILFDTYTGDIYGQMNFGTSYERYLYDLQLTNSEIARQIRVDLNKIDLRGFTPEIKVFLGEGTEQDIAVIDIALMRDNKVYNKTYRIS